MNNYNQNGGGFDFSRPPDPYGGFNGFGGSPNDLRIAQEKEKKALFKNASKLGALLILYEVFNSLFVNVYYIVCYAFYHGGISLNMTVVKTYLREEQTELIQTSAFSMTANLFVVVMSIIALLIVAELILKVRVHTLIKPYKGFAKQGAEWTPLCILFNLLAGIIVSIFVQTLGESGVTVPDADFTITSPSTYAVVIQLVYVCIIGPIVEETLYRGIIIKLLSPYGKGLAIFFSALIFGLMHGNIPQAVSAFAGGLIYASIAVYCGSIAPTIVIHILNNVFASITDIGDALNLSSAYDIYLAVQIVVIFLGFYGLFVKLRGLISGIKRSEPACALKTSKRYFTVLTNIFILIYLLNILSEYVDSFIRYN
jgi:hypothetical protein